MAVYKFAELDKWAAKCRRRQDVIVKQATSNLIADIRIAPGTTRGGSRQRGTIPRDLGNLAASLQSSLMGSSSISGSGANSHVLVVGGMRAGDVARFSWGGPLAPYARWQHDGTSSMAGTFWIDVAAGKWPNYVKAAIAEAKARIR